MVCSVRLEHARDLREIGNRGLLLLCTQVVLGGNHKYFGQAIDQNQ